MAQRSKSTLFLIEQLIVIAVFAICAAACISIFTAAYFYTNDSAAASKAIVKAESAAEVFKATGGNVAVAADILGGTTLSTDSGMIVYYDKEWQICGIIDASYLLSLVTDTQNQTNREQSLITGTLTIIRYTGEQLVSFPLAVRADHEVMSNE